MKPKKLDSIVEKLTATRRDLLQLVDQVDEDQWSSVVYSDKEEWHALDLLRHLTDAEKGMTMTIERICDGLGGVPEDFDLDRYNASSVQKRSQQRPADLLAEMEINRLRLLELMNGLSEEDLEKEGRHASLRIMTIEAILNLIADHELWHTKDMNDVLIKGA